MTDAWGGFVEVPGARETLERHGRVLREELLGVAAHFAPRQGLPVVMSREPDDHFRYEPLWYARRATLRLTADFDPAVVVQRIAHRLAEQGWHTTCNASSTAVATAAATRDGFFLWVEAYPGLSRVDLGGSTPPVLLYGDPPGTGVVPPPPPPPPPSPPRPFVPPEPVVTEATRKPGHVLCFDCDGLGWCPECLTRGYLLDDLGERQRCVVCFGSRICQICGGFGQKSLAEMPSWERRRYPDAPDDPR
ncbi:hypothetical protein AB0883_04525 [Micromonospora sp. NPDC047812]|uniref:hypothetical protein n=1 Tax=Micromonospora sp. NPDC047812 TaxID=3155742 RepID=UPI0034547EDF